MDPLCESRVVAKNSRFSGTGVLYVPGRGKIVGASQRGRTCPGCEWGTSIACYNDGRPGGGDDDVLCGSALAACRAEGGALSRLHFRTSASAPWRYVTSLCLGGGEDPVTPAQIALALREPFEKMVPAQRPGFQPAGGALVQLPTIFYAGQPSYTSGTANVLGFDVTISATPTWTWRFEPGVSKAFSTPGAPYPNKDVTHTYTTTGRRGVVLTTSWQGEYAILGDGPYGIAAPVVQTSPPLGVAVYEARAHLVDGQQL